MGQQDKKQEQKQDQTAKEPYHGGTLLLNAVQAVRLLEQLDDAQLIAELQEHTQLTAELVKFVVDVNVDKIKKSKNNYDSVFFKMKNHSNDYFVFVGLKLKLKEQSQQNCDDEGESVTRNDQDCRNY